MQSQQATQPAAELTPRLLDQLVTRQLWDIDISTLSQPQRWLVVCVRLGHLFFNELTTGLLTLQAMSLVYTTLLSIVPVIAVSFSILKAFGVHNQVEPMLLHFVAPMGEQGAEVVARILVYVENLKVGVLGALGLAMLLYTVISLIHKVEKALNTIWRTQGNRSLARRFSDYLSIVIVGPVLIFTALGITASAMHTPWVQSLIQYEPFGTVLILSQQLLPFVLVVAAFGFIYMLVPNAHVRPAAALVGALVGGGLWKGVGGLFAAFATSSVQYAAVYSSLAILILFMVWLYLSWLILLFGAHVAYLYQYPHQIRRQSGPITLSAVQQEQLGLLLMVTISDRYCSQQPAWSRTQLAQQLHLPLALIDSQLEQLQQAGLLLEDTQAQALVPAHAPSSIRITDLFATLRQQGASEPQLLNHLQHQQRVDQLLVAIEEQVTRHLGDQTLYELTRSQADEAPAAVPHPFVPS